MKAEGRRQKAEGRRKRKQYEGSPFCLHASFRYPPPVPSRLSPRVILLGLVSLLNDAASEMIYPLLPVFLTATLGASAVDIGLIEGAADGLASILKYFAGSWSDRMPRR